MSKASNGLTASTDPSFHSDGDVRQICDKPSMTSFPHVSKISVAGGDFSAITITKKGSLAERHPVKRNNLLLIGVLIAAFCIMCAVFVFSENYDNDVWFFLATGKEIVENGIPYTNPFAMHEDMGIVVQQWLVCVWVYLIYSAGGFVATGVWTSFLFALFVLSAFLLGRQLRRNRYGGEWVLLVLLIASYGMTTYMSVRPHLYSMIAFIWVVYCLERYRSTGKMSALMPLPFILAIHVNIQAAMAPFDLVIIACYLIPDFLKPLHDRGLLTSMAFYDASYKRLPLLAALLICLFAMLLNPYTIDGALYLLSSYSSADYDNYISEMGAFVPANSTTFATILIVMFMAAISIGLSGFKNINLPLVLLAAGTTCMSFQHVRNIWVGCLFCYMLIMWSTRSYSIGSTWKMARLRAVEVFSVVLGCAMMIGIMAFSVPKLEALPEDNKMTPVSSMNYLVKNVYDPADVNVFTFFNSGGYIEWRGFKVNMDPRPELWAPAITKQDFDYYVEYIDMARGRTSFNQYMEKYDFDVYIIPTNEAAADLVKGDPDYIEIPSGNDYYAFAKKSILE